MYYRRSRWRERRDQSERLWSPDEIAEQERRAGRPFPETYGALLAICGPVHVPDPLGSLWRDHYQLIGCHREMPARALEFVNLFSRTGSQSAHLHAEDLPFLCNSDSERLFGCFIRRSSADPEIVGTFGEAGGLASASLTWFLEDEVLPSTARRYNSHGQAIRTPSAVGAGLIAVLNCATLFMPSTFVALPISSRLLCESE